MAGQEKPQAVKKEQEKGRTREASRKEWDKPVLEDVSGKVMAQPYIRFT